VKENCLFPGHLASRSDRRPNAALTKQFRRGENCFEVDTLILEGLRRALQAIDDGDDFLYGSAQRPAPGPRGRLA